MNAKKSTRAAPSAPKPHLVRGLDPIPPDWEAASGLRAMRGLYRSRTVLKRLIGNAVNADQVTLARDLRGVLTAVERAVQHQTGGFVIREIKPEAAKWAQARRKAQRWIDRQKSESRP
jgi:hypothetical protein